MTNVENLLYSPLWWDAGGNYELQVTNYELDHLVTKKYI